MNEELRALLVDIKSFIGPMNASEEGANFIPRINAILAKESADQQVKSEIAEAVALQPGQPAVSAAIERKAEGETCAHGYSKITACVFCLQTERDAALRENAELRSYLHLAASAMQSKNAELAEMTHNAEMLTIERTRLKELLAEAQKDAERYRWLTCRWWIGRHKGNEGGITFSTPDGFPEVHNAKELDAAIDAARSAENQLNPLAHEGVK